MKNITFLLLILPSLLLLFSPLKANAYNLPPVNLGLTSLVDGAPPPQGPGHHFVQYFLNLDSDKLTNNSGDHLFGSGAGEDLDIVLSATQYLYLSKNKPFLNAYWGFDITQLYVSPDISYSGTGGPITAAHSGLGDTVLGLYLQSDLIMGKKGPKYFHRLELNISLPTGDYDRTKGINPGNNIVSVSPYYALTYFVSPKWTFSTRIHYLWNSKNNETNLSPVASTSTPGTAVHLNFASSYEILPHQLRLGLNGYYLKQITDHKLDGAKIRGAREQVLAIGPGALYSFNKKTHIFFNAYFESSVRNRAKSTSTVLRFVRSL